MGELGWMLGLFYSPFTYMMLLVCLIAAMTTSISDYLSLNAGLAVALFFLLFAMSNAWRFVPGPAETGDYATDFEALRLWVARANAARQMAFLVMIAAVLGFAFWLSFGFPDRAPMLTRMFLWTDFMAQLSEVPEYALCKVTSEWLGREHIAIIEGLDRGGCTREYGWFGMFVAPSVAVVPLLFILWRTLRKRWAGEDRLS